MILFTKSKSLRLVPIFHAVRSSYSSSCDVEDLIHTMMLNSHERGLHIARDKMKEAKMVCMYSWDLVLYTFLTFFSSVICVRVLHSVVCCVLLCELCVPVLCVYLSYAVSIVCCLRLVCHRVLLCACAAVCVVPCGCGTFALLLKLDVVGLGFLPCRRLCLKL